MKLADNEVNLLRSFGEKVESRSAVVARSFEAGYEIVLSMAIVGDITRLSRPEAFPLIFVNGSIPLNSSVSLLSPPDHAYIGGNGMGGLASIL